MAIPTAERDGNSHGIAQCDPGIHLGGVYVEDAAPEDLPFRWRESLFCLVPIDGGRNTLCRFRPIHQITRAIGRQQTAGGFPG